MKSAIIPEHPLYTIWENGTITNTKTGATITPQIQNGRMRIVLDGKTEYVSRLVASAFLGPSDGRDAVHKDGNYLNVHAYNLEWKSRSDNQRERNFPNRFYENSPKLIRVVETNTVYFSIKECAKAIGGNTAGIRKQLNGETKAYKGLTFELVR